MKKLALLLAAVLPVTLCHADLTIVQKIEQGGTGKGQDMMITTKFKGDHARVDINPQMATIIDLGSGDATTLIIPQKAAMKMSGDMVKQMKKSAMPDAGATKIEPLTATGKKDTINGFACDEYTTMVNGKKVTLWITKDAPDAQKAISRLSKLSAGANDPLGAALSQDDLPGFPVRAEIEVPEIGKLIATVVTLNTDAIADSEFVVPADFKQITPSMPPVGR
jgi:Domain of unknown function (DUF4412)